MRVGAILMAIAITMMLNGCTHRPRTEPTPTPTPTRDAGPGPSLTDAAPPPTPEVPAAPLPAIAGGTALVTASDELLVSDPDRARVWLVDLTSRTARHVELTADDEPGRIAQDGAGRAHVVLRRSGQVLDLELDPLRILARRDVCPAPRGIDWDASGDVLHVACADGRLVTLPAESGEPTRTVWLDPDLRDVVVADGQLYVSRFRSAELLTLDAAGVLVDRRRPDDRTVLGRGDTPEVSFTPNVAWRLRRHPSGGVVMVHQRSSASPVQVDVTGYSGGGSCRISRVAEPAVTVFAPSGAPRSSGTIDMFALAVDVAVSSDGGSLFLASAASSASSAPLPIQGGVRTVSAATMDTPCVHWDGSGSPGGSVVAVEALSDARVVSVERNPLAIVIRTPSGATDRIALSDAAFFTDRGHDLFHAVAPAMVACASCHPEGAEDGHVWDFAGTGRRRTQTLLGGILGTEPFHWDGDQPDMGAIMTATFADRMGASFGAQDVAAIASWLQAQPLPRGVLDDGDAIARGRALFEGEEVGCASCHAGDALTNNANADVGTGGSFQVPSLRGVLHRAPFLHDGCAARLEDVIAGECSAPDQHGHVSQLDADQRSDLAAYLRSL